MVATLGHVGMTVDTVPRFNEHVRDRAKRVHFNRWGHTVMRDALEWRLRKPKTLLQRRMRRSSAIHFNAGFWSREVRQNSRKSVPTTRRSFAVSSWSEYQTRSRYQPSHGPGEHQSQPAEEPLLHLKTRSNLQVMGVVETAHGAARMQTCLHCATCHGYSPQLRHQWDGRWSDQSWCYGDDARRDHTEQSCPEGIQNVSCVHRRPELATSDASHCTPFGVASPCWKRHWSPQHRVRSAPYHPEFRIEKLGP